MGHHATIHGKTTETWNGQDGKWIPLRTNSAGQLEIGALSGEFPQFNRLAGGPIVKYMSISADTTVVTGACIFYGIKVGIAGTAVTVYDNTAASGTSIITAEATTAAGAVLTPAGAGIGVLMNNGIHVDLTGGTLIVMYADAV